MSKTPLWYAYIKKSEGVSEDETSSCWYFISAKEALLRGVLRKTPDPFLTIDLNYFTQITNSTELSKLLLNLKIENSPPIQSLANEIYNKLDHSHQWEEVNIASHHE